MRSASGSPPTTRTSAAAAAGSAATRAAPSTLRSRSSAWSRSMMSMSSSSEPGRPASRARLVTITAQVALPGSSGATCASPAASSRTIRMRRPANMLRYISARSSSPGGMAEPGIPSARRNRASTSAGPAGWAWLPRRSL